MRKMYFNAFTERRLWVPPPQPPQNSKGRIDPIAYAWMHCNPGKPLPKQLEYLCGGNSARNP